MRSGTSWIFFLEIFFFSAHFYCVDFYSKLTFLFLSKNVRWSELFFTLDETFQLSKRSQFLLLNRVTDLNFQFAFIFQMLSTPMLMRLKLDFRRYCCHLLLCSYRFVVIFSVQIDLCYWFSVVSIVSLNGWFSLLLIFIDMWLITRERIATRVADIAETPGGTPRILSIECLS